MVLNDLVNKKYGNINIQRGINDFIIKYIGYVSLVSIIIIFSLLSDDFLTLKNIQILLKQAAIPLIVALGMTFVILAGFIDLSVGSIVGLSGALMAIAGTNIWSLFIGILIGSLCGFFNGVIFTWSKIPSFMTTLGMLIVARGFTLLFTRGHPIPIDYKLVKLINGNILGIPKLFILSFFLFIIAYIIEKKTMFGRQVRAMGGSESAAELFGLSIKRLRLSIFMVSGFFAGIGGVLQALRIGAAVPNTGSGLELDMIAAVVLGGTLLTGGEGGIDKTIIGVFIIGILTNGLNLLGTGVYVQMMIKGIVLCVAVIASTNRKMITETK